MATAGRAYAREKVAPLVRVIGVANPFAAPASAVAGNIYSALSRAAELSDLHYENTGRRPRIGIDTRAYALMDRQMQAELDGAGVRHYPLAYSGHEQFTRLENTLNSSTLFRGPNDLFRSLVRTKLGKELIMSREWDGLTDAQAEYYFSQIASALSVRRTIRMLQTAKKFGSDAITEDRHAMHVEAMARVRKLVPQGTTLGAALQRIRQDGSLSPIASAIETQADLSRLQKACAVAAGTSAEYAGQAANPKASALKEAAWDLAEYMMHQKTVERLEAAARKCR